MTARPADIIANDIQANVLPDHKVSAFFAEDEWPFTLLQEEIILTRQTGRTSDEDIRDLDVEVWIFTKANADGSDMNKCFDDATAAMDWLLTNYRSGCIFNTSVIEDVTGPYVTGQNRRYYRFTVRTLVNS